MQLNELKTKFLGQDAIYYKVIDSTQLEIFRRIDNKSIKNGTLVYADIQTKGKGTHGRKWYTEQEDNIAFSFFIQLDCNIKCLENLTLEIAEVIVAILKNTYKIQIEIKEPNDLCYNGKKIGGILTQTKVQGNCARYIVIGVGINTLQERFNDDIKEVASSIKNEFGIEVDRDKLISDFCNEFEKKIIKRIGE